MLSMYIEAPLLYFFIKIPKMKIIPIYNDERYLVRKARKLDRAAQNGLYKKYAPKMLAVCRSYVKDLQFAQDVMHQGFLKVFMHLDSFSEKGSFEGWVRRIMVHESLNFLKKKRWVVYINDINEHNEMANPGIALKNDAEYLLKLIDQLPNGYRIVFILHAIEGYTHKEIAKTLHLTENTSRSKLSKARKILQKKFNLIIKRNEAL